MVTYLLRISPDNASVCALSSSGFPLLAAGVSETVESVLLMLAPQQGHSHYSSHITARNLRLCRGRRCLEGGIGAYAGTCVLVESPEEACACTSSTRKQASEPVAYRLV